jgi:hypothetical protein
VLLRAALACRRPLIGCSGGASGGSAFHVRSVLQRGAGGLARNSTRALDLIGCDKACNKSRKIETSSSRLLVNTAICARAGRCNREPSRESVTLAIAALSLVPNSILEDAHPPRRPVAIPSAREVTCMEP